jgi:hypothetical protein
MKCWPKVEATMAGHCDHHDRTLSVTEPHPAGGHSGHGDRSLYSRHWPCIRGNWRAVRRFHLLRISGHSGHGDRSL